MEVLSAVGYVSGAYIIYLLLDWLIRLPYVGWYGGRYVLVTGCDTGFGHDLTKRLDELGCQVFAGCLTHKGETLLRESCSDRVRTLHLDVSHPDSIEKALSFVQEELPEGQGLWAVVNNAGISGKAGPPDWMSLQDYKQVLDVNVYGLIDVTMTFLPLVKQARGRVINMASVVGRVAVPYLPAYVISKYGVEAYSDILRRSVRPFGVTVHLLEPGLHLTNISKEETVLHNVQSSFQQAKLEVQKEYGEHYVEELNTRLIQKMSLVMKNSTDDVISAYMHALFSYLPRSRYVVGMDARFIWIPLGRLPAWLSDFLCSVRMPIPAACKR